MDDVKDFGTPKRISDKTVNLTIDGVSVSVPEGTSVMHAASLSGVMRGPAVAGTHRAP